MNRERGAATPSVFIPSPTIARRAADLWWLHPTRIVLLALLPIYLSILAFDFTRIVKNIYVPSWLYFFGAALIVTMAVGIQLALTHPRPGPTVMPPRISHTVMMVLLLPTLMAYAVWFGPLLGNPQVLVEIVLGRRSEVRDSITTLPGVTTMTQFGIAYAIAYAIKCGAGVQRVSRIERWGFYLLVVLAVFRAFAWAERLAVIELLVCYAVARLAYLPITRPDRWRQACLLPAVAPFFLYLVFTASEYFRAWDFYSDQYDSVWAFTLDRLITYYATAVNNGIGMLVDTDKWPYYHGAFLLEWPFFMPGLGRILELAIGNPRADVAIWLDTYGRPEFNSPTAYFRVVLDIGFANAALYFLAVGYLIGRAYQSFRRGRVWGLLAYPVFVLFLIESIRYSYLSQTRIAPLALALIILALDIRRQRRITDQTTPSSHGLAQRAMP